MTADEILEGIIPNSIIPYIARVKDTGYVLNSERRVLERYIIVYTNKQIINKDTNFCTSITIPLNKLKHSKQNPANFILEAEKKAKKSLELFLKDSGK